MERLPDACYDTCTLRHTFAQTGANVPAFTNTQILGHTKTNTIGHTQIQKHKRKAFTNPQTLGHTLTQNKCICNLSM